MPLAWGWKAVVVMCSTCISVHHVVHMPEVNCAPLLVVTWAGRPNLATQLLMKLSSTTSAVISWRGVASNHCMLRSITVSR